MTGWHSDQRRHAQHVTDDFNALYSRRQRRRALKDDLSAMVAVAAVVRSRFTLIAP